MKRSSACILIAALALCASQECQAQSKKSVEANKLAREGADAAKKQDWDKAVQMLRKATDLDHKYADELSAVYQRAGYAAATEQRYQDAINDYNEALKLTPQDARIYEQRAAVEMKTQAYDKALSDYSELIKLKPKEVRYYNYRAYIYELRNELKNALADTEKVLQMEPNNQDAKARKQRLEQNQAIRRYFGTPSSLPPVPPKKPAADKTKP
jgi:tetratricopeptide (TPR) repeat protein